MPILSPNPLDKKVSDEQLQDTRKYHMIPVTPTILIQNELEASIPGD